MTQILVPRRTLDVVLTCDPAISQKSSACRSAIIVAAMSPAQRIFVLDAWAGRQNDPFLLIDQVLMMSMKWGARLIGIEGVAYQQVLQPFIERVMRQRNLYFPVEMMMPDRNEKKEQRILSLQPFFKTGQIFMQQGMTDLIDEVTTFPRGKTNDLLDALAYAIRLLLPKNIQTHTGLDIRLQELAKRDASSARYWRKDAEKRGLLEPEPTLDDILEGETEEAALVGIGEYY